MQIYLVGGAVRDGLLGLPVKERDWVVVGASPQKMLELGYRPVGKDFPVFLHPQTHEEYALARTERKTGPGYTGFSFYAAPDVTLEQDLKRRDLTINAMAQNEAGDIIDPFGGQLDLKNKILRHVSDAFVEDPVRILRVARFAARLGDFHLHPDTLAFMRRMVAEGEVNALVAERVWQELERVLSELYPQRFFEILQQSHALEILFPELLNSPHLLLLQTAATLELSATVRLAVLLHALELTKIKALCERYRVPRDYCDLALIVAQHHTSFQQVFTLNAEQILTLLEALDVFRRPERLTLFISACQLIHSEQPEEKAHYLQQAYQVARSVDPKQFVAQGLQGNAIGEALRAKRIQALSGL